ncbi:MAG: DUF4269 domain-containing protein [Saprospirales bacterium]|nr:MAG: DUF4269 domain-containing protein [Saprospirales bacterium]
MEKLDRAAAEKKFLSSDYLKDGNFRQRWVWRYLTDSEILSELEPYQPVIAGTIPIEIDTLDSDLDILCGFDCGDGFMEFLEARFSACEGFEVKKVVKQGLTSVVAKFRAETLSIDIFGQPIAPVEQMAFVHMINEYLILQERGEDFRREVIKLKEKGVKTEPAFARLLGLEGDPYQLLADSK